MNGHDLGRVLVTGGGGFLGTALVARLRAEGCEVRSLSRRFHPRVDALGAEQIQGDVADRGAVDRAVAGCSTIFHTAAKAGVWGPELDYIRANVDGARNVIQSAIAAGAKRLVYTSSPSVVFDGRDLEGVDESAHYCQKFEAFYPKTKAAAERMVLAASGPVLATVSLRPHLVWGPGDNNLYPRIVARAAKGRLVRIGGRDPLIDPIYIENAVDGHMLAATHLEPGSSLAGRVYFVSQGETIRLWDMINSFLKVANLPPVSRSVPRPAALAAAGVLELFYKMTGREEEPPLTRFLVRQLSNSHWFNSAAALRDFGYQPRVTIAQGMERLAQAEANERPESSANGDGWPGR